MVRNRRLLPGLALVLAGTLVLAFARAEAPKAAVTHVSPADIAIGVVIGRASEYFDYFVYGVASVVVFPALFFPFATPLYGILYSFAVFSFGVMFVAFGVVPDRWIAHSDADLGWTKNLIIYGPGDIFKPKALGGHWPFTMSYEALRDIIAILIHVWYFGLLIFLWGKWQKRGDVKPGTEVATSSFGRPLVKKG